MNRHKEINEAAKKLYKNLRIGKCDKCNEYTPHFNATCIKCISHTSSVAASIQCDEIEKWNAVKELVSDYSKSDFHVATKAHYIVERIKKIIGGEV